MDAIRAAIQALFDTDGDGWQVDAFVIVVGIERLVDGAPEATSWYATPAGQAEWATTGLLAEAVEMRQTIDADSD